MTGWPDPETAGVIGRAVLEPALRGEALALLDEMEDAGLNLYDLGEVTVTLGDPDAAVDRLERAAAEGYAAVVNTGTDPAWDAERADPRMVRLMAELGPPNGYDPASDGS